MYLWENVLSLRFPASLNQDGIWLKREAVSPWWRGKGSPSWVSDPVWLVGLYPGLLSDTCGASPWLVKRVACLLLALIPLHGLVWGTGGIWSLALWGSMFTVLNNQLDVHYLPGAPEPWPSFSPTPRQSLLHSHSVGFFPPTGQLHLGPVQPSLGPKKPRNSHIFT